ncbi:MAG: hypothetical protein AABY33_04260 [Pseudomonadota bacterium]
MNNPYGWDNKVDSKVLDFVQYRQSTAVKIVWKTKILQDLLESLPEEKQPLPNTIPHSQEFINRLPIAIHEPSLNVEVTGEILFEWYKNDSGKITIFSVILDGKGIIYSLYEKGKRTNNYGHMNFCQESIDKILIDINHHFGNSDGKRLKA